jgi:hypothetical protein
MISMPALDPETFGQSISAIEENIGVILSNLEYVQKELAGLEIDEALRRDLLCTCQALEGDGSDGKYGSAERVVR